MDAEWIPYAKPTYFGREIELVTDALASTWISGGAYVDEFEKKVATLLDVPYALAVSNGTTALQLALVALGIGPGDEVIVPAFTFAAAANMVLAVGAKPIAAEVDPYTWCIDPASLERVVNNHTRAIIAVHLYGNVSEMDALLEIARQRQLDVIEDAAEATFSKYKGRSAGSMGRVGTLSFHAAKTVTTGEGGMVLTADKELYQRMTLLRSQGMQKGKPFYWHDVAGFNFRLTNLQAALGCAQLEKLDLIRSERTRVAATYRRLLQTLSGFRLQTISQTVEPVIWAIAGQIVEHEEDIRQTESRRDLMMQLLRQRGIETRPGFYTLASMPPYKCGEWPFARKLAASVISLPTYPALDDNKIARVCRALQESLDEVMQTDVHGCT